MAILGDPPAFPGQDPIYDLAKFYFILPIARIINGVGPGLFDIDMGVVKPGAHLAGKKKCPAHADSANGVELVRIKQGFGFKGLGEMIFPEAVGSDAMDDIFFLRRGKGKALKDGPGHLGAFFRVAYAAV
jgi:hypothetical protein